MSMGNKWGKTIFHALAHWYHYTIYICGTQSRPGIKKMKHSGPKVRNRSKTSRSFKKTRSGSDPWPVILACWEGTGNDTKGMDQYSRQVFRNDKFRDCLMTVLKCPGLRAQVPYPSTLKNLLKSRCKVQARRKRPFNSLGS